MTIGNYFKNQTKQNIKEKGKGNINTEMYVVECIMLIPMELILCQFLRQNLMFWLGDMHSKIYNMMWNLIGDLYETKKAKLFSLLYQ